MKMRRYALGLALVLSCGALTACGVLEEYHGEESYVIGAVTKSGSSEYWMSVRLGMEAAAKEVGADLIFLTPDSESDREVQYKMAETLLKRDVDVLAVSPIDSYDEPEYLDLAKEKGIPVISFDTAFQKGEIPYVGIDNREAGYELGAYLAEQMNYEGQVGIVAGDLRQSCHRLRMDGFLDYMKGQEKMEVAFVESGYSNLLLPGEMLQSLQKMYPDLEGILVTSASTAMGILDALGKEEKKVVTVDSQEDTLRALEEGSLCGMAAQSGYEIGYETISYIKNMGGEEPVEKERILEAEIVTGENLMEYEKKIGEGR